MNRNTLQIVVVAGGLATRMLPICEEIPKCLIDVHGKPLLEHQLDVFIKQGFRDFVFCIAHLAEKVRDYFGNGEKWGVKIEYAMDSGDGETLLGTAGAVKSAEAKLQDAFMVYYGDTISHQDFGKFVNFHFVNEAACSISLRKKPKGYKSSSIITLSDCSEITNFIEKPTQDIVDRFDKYTTYINNGIFILNRQVISLIPDGEKFDFSHDVFPKLIDKGEKIYGYVSSDFYREIGRLEKYEKVKKEDLKLIKG